MEDYLPHSWPLPSPSFLILHLLLYYSYCCATTEMAEGSLPIKQHVSIVYFISVLDPGREVLSTLCDVSEWRRRRVNAITVTILILHNYVQHLGICLSLRVLKNMLLSVTADNFVCLLRQLIKWRFNSRKFGRIHTHTKSSQKLYNSQIKLLELLNVRINLHTLRCHVRT